ncbi:C-type lectin domain family 2 member B-like isoform X2 [Paroedura picta]|uniref:C-type lectin domain family 2 member B-like isoform X2 n=1 Tax=Paroedura picta TaxID=143630 RepID=UPI0040564F69
MAGYDIEKQEEHHPMNSHTKENGIRNGNCNPYLSEQNTANLKPPFGIKHTPVLCIALLSMILNLALVISLIGLTVRRREPSPAPPTCPVASCPPGWVGFLGKCYYFVETEANWTSSKMYCSSLNASLAMLDSQEEMDFMMRYKSKADHWIGLQRNLSQPWTWIDGTILNDRFTVLGGGSCAYMNLIGVASSSCSSKEHFICSKPIDR